MNQNQCSQMFLWLGLGFLLVSFLMYGQIPNTSQSYQQQGGVSDADRIFSVKTDGKIIYIDDQARPTLHLKRGQFYIFRLDESMRNHPFYLTFADDGGGRLGKNLKKEGKLIEKQGRLATPEGQFVKDIQLNLEDLKMIPRDTNLFPGEYRAGVEGSRAIGSKGSRSIGSRITGSDLTLYVTRNTPRILYYQSALKSHMGGTILAEWDQLPVGYIGRVPQWRTYYLLTASQTYNLPMISERKGFI